jgi:MSHA biogenesis protein MshK
MSLINDALKRASTKPRVAEAAAAAAVPIPLQPADYTPRGANPAPLVLCIVGVGALLVSGAFWLKSKGTPPQPLAGAAVPPAAAITVATPALAAPILSAAIAAEPTATEAVQVVDPPAQPAQNVKVALANPVKSPSPATPTAGKSPAATPVQYKLQAIYYRMKGPTVVINGKTLRVGDTVQGAKLTAIERNAAEIEVSGKRRKLAFH